MTQEQQPRRPGRPATGQTPKRNVRIGTAWDLGEQLAAKLDMTMTEYVETALRRENARIERAQARLDANPELVEQIEQTIADPTTRVRRGRPNKQT